MFSDYTGYRWTTFDSCSLGNSQFSAYWFKNNAMIFKRMDDWTHLLPDEEEIIRLYNELLKG